MESRMLEMVHINFQNLQTIRLRKLCQSSTVEYIVDVAPVYRIYVTTTIEQTGNLTILGQIDCPKSNLTSRVGDFEEEVRPSHWTISGIIFLMRVFIQKCES